MFSQNSNQCCIEETKAKYSGTFKLENYHMYELVRKDCDQSSYSKSSGGGLDLGCHQDLKPVFIRDGGDNIEVLSVNIFPNKVKIRCCVAYGP